MEVIERSKRLQHLMETDTDIFQRRLSEVMNEAGISNSRFETDGVCIRESAASYKRGERMPSSRCLLYICNYLNVSADWLLGLSDEKRKVW